MWGPVPSELVAVLDVSEVALLAISEEAADPDISNEAGQRDGGGCRAGRGEAGHLERVEVWPLGDGGAGESEVGGWGRQGLPCSQVQRAPSRLESVVSDV